MCIALTYSGGVKGEAFGTATSIQTITGGTGELAGASGALRASGTFSPTAFSGSSSYEGQVCLPRLR